MVSLDTERLNTNPRLKILIRNKSCNIKRYGNKS